MVEREFKIVKNTRNDNYYKHAIYYAAFNLFNLSKKFKPKGELELQKFHLFEYYIDVIAKV